MSCIEMFAPRLCKLSSAAHSSDSGINLQDTELRRAGSPCDERRIDGAQPIATTARQSLHENPGAGM
jgi:hypothetical protein